MDISLETLKDAFSDTAYQRRMRDFKVFLFVLVTPADSKAFSEFLKGMDDLHHLTGGEVLVVGPSLRINGQNASRKVFRALQATTETGLESV